MIQPCHFTDRPPWTERLWLAQGDPKTEKEPGNFLHL